MRTFIITEVDAAVEIEVFAELRGVGREQTVPVMIVLRLAHHQHGTVFARGIDVFDGSIVERAVRLAELGLQFAVISAVPVTVRIAVVLVSLSRIAVPASDRHVSHGAQR